MFTRYLGLIAAASSASAAVLQGFNYASLNNDGTYRVQSDFETEFATAQNLVGTSGFNSARLYTMIQANTPTTPISAIPAAIKTNTTLLLGIWCSAGETIFNNELAALNAAIEQYGSSFTNLVVGLSVGSEDLYRDSEIGQKSNAGIGAGPQVIASYISQTRNALKNTALKDVSIGHVDTWTSWVNGTNQPVIDAVDWLGFDAYPYFQNTMPNDISNAQSLFFDAYDKTTAASGGKPVWVTETGWPVSGKTERDGVPSLKNAESYWKQVGCKILGRFPTYWYTLDDYSPSMTVPSFGVVSSESDRQPLYNLTCAASDKQMPTENQNSATTTFASSPATATTSSGSGSGAGSGSSTRATTTAAGTGTAPSQTGGPGSGGSGSGSGTGTTSAVTPSLTVPTQNNAAGQVGSKTVMLLMAAAFALAF